MFDIVIGFVSLAIFKPWLRVAYFFEMLKREFERNFQGSK
jgi:hypothetical protein